MFRSPCDGRDNEFKQTFSGENEINMNIDVDMINANMAGGMMAPPAGYPAMGPAMGMVAAPVIEPIRERVVNRTIMHEVPHVCPTRTRIINNHVYRHTYRPHNTCCEENVVTNVQCGSCCDTAMPMPIPRPAGPCCNF